MTKRRKALRDDRQLQELLTRQSPGLVLYGHLHRDQEHVYGTTRIYGSASASSTISASYRVFDLNREPNGWQCEMRLMTLTGIQPSSKVLNLASYPNQN